MKKFEHLSFFICYHCKISSLKYSESICFSSLLLNITLVRFQSQEDSNGLTTNISQQPIPLLVLFPYLDYRRVPLSGLLPHPFPDSIRGDPSFLQTLPGPAGTKFRPWFMITRLTHNLVLRDSPYIFLPELKAVPVSPDLQSFTKRIHCLQAISRYLLCPQTGRPR